MQRVYIGKMLKGIERQLLMLTHHWYQKTLILCFLKQNMIQTKIKDVNTYIALGELKGGIDPAGADEHWKTANTALNRIRKAFKKMKPVTFFIGAAIENSMAEEIYKQTLKDKMFFAANLTVEKQLNDICHLLCEL